MDQKYSCPVCGWDQLETRPYKNMPDQVHPVTVTPPYEKVWGGASYEVCDCCGFEFGNDDDASMSTPSTFEGYREEWLQEGALWFNPINKPVHWNLALQFQKAGIEMKRD